jgi:glycosyltransferase involved in cell wall biosynthesis
MRVLLTPHIEHYTIGLSSELSKLVKLTLLTEKRFNTQTNQIVISNLPIPHFKGLMRKIIFKISGDIYDVIHVNTSQDGLFAGNFDKLLVTEHGWPDPKIVEESERDYYFKEQSALLQLYEMGVPIVTISNYSAEMLRKLYGIKVRKVIYHGLLENFISKPKAAPIKHRILYVSRLVSAKEPFVLIKALNRIRNKLKFKAIIRRGSSTIILFTSVVNPFLTPLF